MELPGPQAPVGYEMKRWRWVVGLLLFGLVGAAGSQLRNPDYTTLSPVMPTSEKAIFSLSASDGLRFSLDGPTPLISGAASQAHFTDAAGQLRIIATDPTVLNDRLQPDAPTPPRCSTLFERADPGGDRKQLFFPPCINAEGDRTSAPVQCVDPTLVRLPDGRTRLFFVRMVGREDPAFSTEPNHVHSAITGPDGSWVFEPGVRLSAVGVADPDVVALPSGGSRMYFTRGDAPGPGGQGSAPAVFSARSENGLQFSMEPGTRVAGCSASATVALPGGGYRMYCHRRDIFEHGPGADPVATIISNHSADGLSFRRESGTRVGPVPVVGARSIGAGAPSISRGADGRYRMLITTVLEPHFPWNYAVFHTNSRHFDRVQESQMKRVRAERNGRD
jgi:hypothetical protein